jgi:serine/threonine protein phosphatase PrpC
MLRSKLDALFSGTTCNFCLMLDNFLYVTNIGDSRSVIGYIESNQFKSKPLSFDHKPSIPSEKQRILRNNGRISPMLSQHGRYVGPDRVWLKDEDVPGLAMSRSIGDLVAGSVGVTWKPGIYFSYNQKLEIAIYKLSPEDKII